MTVNKDFQKDFIDYWAVYFVVLRDRKQHIGEEYESMGIHDVLYHCNTSFLVKNEEHIRADNCDA